MRGIRPIKFLLPGFFLLILGVGNLAVGITKVRQLEQALKELELQQPLASNIENSSPLRRLQLAEQTAHRVFQRQKEAEDRKGFYNLIAFGGKIFGVVGFILIIIGSIDFLITNKGTTEP